MEVALYDDVRSLERRVAVCDERWERQREVNQGLESRMTEVRDAVREQTTTLKVTCGVLGFLVVVAGIVFPLVFG